MIINIESLFKSYDHKKNVIEDLNLKIEKGYIYGLLGPNGAGKSTLINIIVGFLNYDKGVVKVFGEDSLKIKKISSKIGYVPQSIALFDDLTVYENIELFASMYNLKPSQIKNKVTELMKMVSLEEQAKKLAKNLSGGMKRRLNIACSLVNDPELLILDEPTVGVDPQSRNHILESLIKLNQKGLTIIYTSHYMEEVERICDYIYIMDMGKIISEGSKSELLNSDLLHFVVDLKKDCQIPLKYQENYHDNKLFLQSKDIRTLITQLENDKIDYLDIEKEKMNLEKLFLRLTGKKLRD